MGRAIDTCVNTTAEDCPHQALTPEKWHMPAVSSECSFHQLSPYIGKLKSSIAADLVRSFSSPGELVVDPFCGAGTIALEARLAGRRVFASDISPYAYALTHAKLNPPGSLESAIAQVTLLLDEASRRPVADLRTVPRWVRAYFHPRTLQEIILFCDVCRERRHMFALSCLLGILHHQRPGFLSYPSSHLVPYLRSKNFPSQSFPELYNYRDLQSRLLKKVVRAYKRSQQFGGGWNSVVQTSIDAVDLPPRIDVVVTSSPYMNALDYGRDNRLRLWFIDPEAAEDIDSSTPATIEDFGRLMTVLAGKLRCSVRQGGYCILVVGHAVSRTAKRKTAEVALNVFSSSNQEFKLIQIVDDQIPDIRRARRDCRGVKGESVIVFRRCK